MSAMTVTFAYNANTEEAEFRTMEGDIVFLMSGLSFSEANTINEAIRTMEKKAFERGVAETVKRVRHQMRVMEEQISLDIEEDEEERLPKGRAATRRREPQRRR